MTKENANNDMSGVPFDPEAVKEAMVWLTENSPPKVLKSMMSLESVYVSELITLLDIHIQMKKMDLKDLCDGELPLDMKEYPGMLKADINQLKKYLKSHKKRYKDLKELYQMLDEIDDDE